MHRPPNIPAPYRQPGGRFGFEGQTPRRLAYLTLAHGALAADRDVPGPLRDLAAAARPELRAALAPEIGAALGFPVCFVPHLLPVRRGLLATCYVQATEDGLRERLENAYAAAPAVRVLPEGVATELARVQGSDAAEIGVFEDRATGRTIVVCAIDNLGKGAAGQAVQNANLALGLAETAGLRLAGVLV